MTDCPGATSGRHYWNPVQVKSSFEEWSPPDIETPTLYQLIEYQYLYCTNCAQAQKVRITDATA